MVLSSVNQPFRATSRPALAVPGLAEFSCAAICDFVIVAVERNKCVDRCRRTNVARALCSTLVAGRSTRNSLSVRHRSVCRSDRRSMRDCCCVRRSTVPVLFCRESRNQLRLRDERRCGLEWIINVRHVMLGLTRNVCPYLRR